MISHPGKQPANVTALENSVQKHGDQGQQAFNDRPHAGRVHQRRASLTHDHTAQTEQENMCSHTIHIRIFYGFCQVLK
jgi:hypothetical protein